MTLLSLFSLLSCIIVIFYALFPHVTVCVCHTEIKGYLLTYLFHGSVTCGQTSVTQSDSSLTGSDGHAGL